MDKERLKTLLADVKAGRISTDDAVDALAVLPFVATAIGFITGSAGAFILAAGVALLVAQSRVEGEIHSIPQVILGAALGAGVVTLVFQVFFR